MQQTSSFLPQGYGFALLCVAVFWSLLVLPGYALLRRLWPSALDGGPLSAIALGYLFSFALATPVCAACYALRLPVAVFSAVLVLAMLGSLLSLWQDGRSFARPSLSWVAIVSGAILVTDLVLGLHSGSNPGGDGRYHASRVRMLLVHGFNSWDPLVPGGRFDDVYHSNVYHALIASSAQLVGLQAPAAWAFALFFAKLAACSAFYHLAWTVLAERWIAWTSSAIFTLSMAPLSMLAYPNTLAVYWLLMLTVSFLVEAVRGERGAWPAVGLAATSLVLPGVHGLYYVFACLLIGPVLLAAFVHARIVRPVPASAKHLVWATLALGLGLPWFAVGHLHHAAPSKQRPNAATPGAEVAPPPPTQTAGAQAVAAAEDTQQTPAAALPAYARAMATRNHGFVQLASGRTMFDLRPQLDLRSEQPQLVMILIAGVALSRRRRELVPILAVTMLVAVMLYVPVVCTFLVKAAGAPWVVRRLCAVLSALHLALVPALLFSLIVQRFAHSLVRVACFVAAIGYAYAHGVDSGAWTRASYLRHGIDGKSLYSSLQSHARKRALFARSIPFAATVALAPQRSGDLVVDCDCYPLALGLDQSSHGMRDIEQRRTDVALLLGGDADLSTRVAILRHYHVDRLFIREPAVFRTLRRIYRQMLTRTESSKNDRVLVLDLSRAAFAIERQNANAKRLIQDVAP